MRAELVVVAIASAVLSLAGCKDPPAPPPARTAPAPEAAPDRTTAEPPDAGAPAPTTDAAERPVGKLELPASTADAPSPIDAMPVTVHGGDVRALGNRFSVPADHGHAIAGLGEVLREAAKRGRTRALEAGEDWIGMLEIHADANTAYGTVVDVMLTGHRAGFDNYAVDVTSIATGDAAVIYVAPPVEWLARPPADPPAPPTVLVKAASVEVMSPGAAVLAMPLDPDRLEDWAGSFVKASHARSARERPTLVIVRAEAAVPLKTVVLVLDALRGRDCTLLAALEGEEIPGTCQLWQAILGAHPPLPAAVLEPW